MRQTKVATEQTRQALLDAAEQLFWQRGAARTSVLDIARTANLTRGAFYYHFKDKVAIFEALLARARAADPALPAVDERSEEHTSELQSLMRISYAVFCLKKKKATHTKHDNIVPLTNILYHHRT